MANLKITLKKSLIGRSEKQVLTAYALGLKKIDDTTVQPDNPQTRGKINRISHLLLVEQAN
jgi:large subunit ribosomal protein L30